jgi:hypothetical protein
VIVYQAAEFLHQLQQSDFPASGPAVARGVLMVEPAEFTVNTECAVDNHYMDLDAEADSSLASKQARGLAQLIASKGIEVVWFPGRRETPDAIFPNNVFATTPERFIVGHMYHPSRKQEADRDDIRGYFQERGYQTIDLSVRKCIAELTGTLIIDSARKIGFCGMSKRVNQAGLEAMHDAFGLKMTFSFQLEADEYHTNVVMMILASRACVIYPPAFVDPAVPEAIARAFPGRTLVLDNNEKNAFAGNCIALTNKDLFMSKTGFDALRRTSREALESWGFDIHSADLHEIEKAGGSLRCMVAEIF